MKEDFKVGWREWVSLPEFGVDVIKAKIDTGAKTSCLHAPKITPYRKNGELWVKFVIHPLQRSDEAEFKVRAKVLERRDVTDSGGHTECRWVVETELMIGKEKRKIDLTLTDRSGMRFRMLVGRSALKDAAVYPSKSFLNGRTKRQTAFLKNFNLA